MGSPSRPRGDPPTIAIGKLNPLHFGRDPNDGILYSGNRHESVPRALYLDRRLTPLEHTAWVVIRFMLQDSGVTTFPTYAQLRPYLTSTPCATQASDETVARALTLLRLTRWLSLVRRQRNPATGRLQGNLYVLHDESLEPYEAIQLDPTYFELVSHSLSHASKAIQYAGQHTLKEITADPLLHGRVLPSRLQLVIQRFSLERDAPQPATTDQPNDDIASGASPGSVGQATVHKSARLPSESEVGSTSRDTSLRNPKSSEVRTVRTDSINKRSTVRRPPSRDYDHLHLPEPFSRLRLEQQSGALIALLQLPIDVQQPVLDEWTARCHASTVRNPAAYLFGLIQRAIRGEFNAWASHHPIKPSGPSMPESPETPDEPTHSSPETAALIAELRNRLRIR